MRYRWLFALVVLALIAPKAVIGAAHAQIASDFLVQQVCDNGAGGHTSADPITCPGQARKLRVGEALPYHKWDNGTPGSASNFSDSYPINDTSGRPRVIATTGYDTQSAYAVPEFRGARPSLPGSTYDVIMYDGNYVSASGTYDPGRGWQPIWSSKNCGLLDSWLFFPKSQYVPFSGNGQIATLNNSSPNCPTNSSFGSAYTYWNFYPAMGYESGKNLDTIKSWHFSGSTVNSDAIEEFYFTKEYGKTRWEAWASSARVGGPDPVALQRCRVGTSGGVSVYGSTTYYLIDCHDWSNVVPISEADWSPGDHWHVDPLFYSSNILSNTHMQCTDGSGVAADCGYGGSCRVMAPWARTGDLNWGFDQSLQGGTRTANCAVQISSASGAQSSIYQDVFITPGATYSYGAALWTPNNGNPNRATIAIWEFDRYGGVTGQHTVYPSLGAEARYFQGTFYPSQNTTKIRFEVYPLNSNVVYEMNDAWVSLVP